MLTFVLRRSLLMVPTLIAISLVSFIIIQLPPGDFLTTLIARIVSEGGSVDNAELAALEVQYGLNDGFLGQYWTWITNIVTEGNFGQSFEWGRPVAELIAERLPWSIVLSIGTLLLTWMIAFPIGLYSAVRQYSIGDYLATVVGFLGLAIPNFLLALVLMWIAFSVFGQSVGGLYSPEWEDSAWNLGKMLDLLGHLWIPMLVLGTAGTAGTIRILRANLLDELRKPYVVAARARGVPTRKLILKYPLRIALNPFISTVGWVLPGLVSGEVIVGQILSLPTMGPMMLKALKSQDMYLAGGIIMMVSVLTVIGTLCSDILLAWLDPRVRNRYS